MVAHELLLNTRWDAMVSLFAHHHLTLKEIAGEHHCRTFSSGQQGNEQVVEKKLLRVRGDTFSLLNLKLIIFMSHIIQSFLTDVFLKSKWQLLKSFRSDTSEINGSFAIGLPWEQGEAQSDYLQLENQWDTK